MAGDIPEWLRQMQEQARQVEAEAQEADPRTAKAVAATSSKASSSPAGQVRSAGRFSGSQLLFLSLLLLFNVLILGCFFLFLTGRVVF